MAPLDDPGAQGPWGAFVDGAPGWLGPALRHCPSCGARLVHGPVVDDHRPRHHCPACGHIAYVNPRLVVTTLPLTEAGELVLLRRGIPPGLDAWAQPGGFLEADETAIQGAIRETYEETRLVVEPTGIVGLYSRPPAAVVVAVYEARITGGRMTPTREAREVRAFPIADIPWAGLAFNTTLWAVRDLVRRLRPGLDVDGLGRESEAG